MSKLTKETVFTDANTALINTREKRYNNVEFSTAIENNQCVLTSNEGILYIDIFDEIVLYLIAKFRFCPTWLAQQWYKNDQTYLGDDPSEKLRMYINFGLVYDFQTAVSNFLMPTNKLATMFNMKLGNFHNPPYNALTHTISELDVMFKCMTGKTDYLDGIKTIPYISRLGLGTLEAGAHVVPESDYAIRTQYFNENLKTFNDQEARLYQEIINGKIITTTDLKENKLMIHKKVDTHEYALKIPDLAVLAPRRLEDGLAMPCSVAIEVEISPKSTFRYKKILDIYWENLIYGTVLYLVNDPKTKHNLQAAIEQLTKIKGEAPSCKILIKEYIIPHQESQLLA